ncbi:probable polyamine transporter At3g13620 [Rhodamnia argentea]|uniref:Probable polyamine transporter At3g13620 n=1 Tax=Rhodamnia argentea TaxID=178133 RepID=A0ABM3HLF7_9MYRT|nr:probable polyamine transporter At3g13620 [Rhodamnia argentea]
MPKNPHRATRRLNSPLRPLPPPRPPRSSPSSRSSSSSTSRSLAGPTAKSPLCKPRGPCWPSWASPSSPSYGASRRPSSPPSSPPRSPATVASSSGPTAPLAPSSAPSWAPGSSSAASSTSPPSPFSASTTWRRSSQRSSRAGPDTSPSCSRTCLAAIVLGVVSLMPFLLMSLIAIPKIRPHRWVSLGQKGVKKDWNLFFNTLFWNLNFWDNVSTVAGEVDRPRRNLPLALLVAVIFTCVSYLIPLFAVTGAVSVHQSDWESGFHAVAAEMIAGKWLKVWIEVGAVLSAVGLFEAQLSSSAYQVLGMADIGILPEFFAARSEWFGTPWVGIMLSSLISIAVSYMDFTDIVSSANFLYSLGMLLEFAAFVWLRRKLPSLKRPYRVPLGVPGLMVMCLIPSAFLVVIMVLATKVVYLVSGLMTVGGIGWFFLMKSCKSRKIFKFSISAVEVASD